MRVLVTDGDNRAALAITRSLGRAGHEVVVGERSAPSLASVSAYCAHPAVYPDPVTEPEDFLSALSEIVRERRVDVLLPVADVTTFLVTSNRQRFGAPCRVPFADTAAIERASDKVELVRMALRLGVAVPHHMVVQTPEAVPHTDLGFPVVIKPWRSRIHTPGGWVSTGVTYAVDRQSLLTDLIGRPHYEFPVMLQERIEGPGMGIFACYDRGRVTALFSHRRLRERPPWGGVSVLCESTPVCPRARESALRLLDELKWHGVAMVEFKRDVRDDVPKLMEINARFWGSLQLAIDAGVDFPRLLVDQSVGAAGVTMPAYRVGVRNRWLWGDMDSLLLTVLGGRRVPIGVARKRLRAIWEFLHFYGHDLYYENPKWDDVRPWLFETVNRFRRAATDGGALGRRVAAALPVAARAGRALPTQIVGRLEDLGVDETGWNALASQSETNSIFQTHQWTRSWLSVFGRKYEPIFVRVSDGTRTLAIAPMVVEGRRPVGRVARFAGDGRADYCDFIISGDKREAIAAIFEALRKDHGWDVIELNNIPSLSQTTEIVREVCDQNGYSTIIEEQFLCPTLLISGHEAEAQGILNKPSLRRRQNYYRRIGSLEFHDLSTAAEIGPYLERFFAQHIARWNNGSGPSLFNRPANRAFYEELTRNLSGTGWLLFSVVESNGHPVAFHYGFDYAGSLLWYKPSFDPVHEKHSPGLVMVQHLIDYAVRNGRRELDFTVGDEPFKRRFTNVTRQTVSIQIFRDSSRHLLELSRRSVGAASKRVWW